MGQFGFQEILVIFIIALLIFGPRKLPDLGKRLGTELRNAAQNAEQQNHSPLAAIVLLILLALAFVYGVMGTINAFYFD